MLGKRIAILLLLLISTASMPSLAGEVPITSFSNLPQYSQLKISPDGRHFAAVIGVGSGESLLAVIRQDDMTVVNRLEIAGNQGIGKIYWANGDRIIASLTIKHGSRDKPFTTGEWIALSVEGDNKGYIFGRNKGLGNATIKSDTGAALLTSILPEEPNKVLMTVYNGGRGSLVKLDITSGRTNQVARLPGERAQVLTDLDGNPRFSVSHRAEGGENYTDLYRKKSNVGWEILQSYKEENTGKLLPLSFINDNELYAIDTVDTDTESLVRLNLRTNEKETVFNHSKVDIDSYKVNRNGQLYALNIMPDYPKSIVIDDDVAEAKWLQDLGATFKGSLIEITSSSNDGEKVVAAVVGDTRAPAYYLYQPKKQTIKKILDPYPELVNVPLSPVNALEVKARDGVSLSAYLTLPAGETKNLPMIVLPHGGPHGMRDRWGFNSEVQLLANRGYAVLQVNFRGSGGFGRDFLYSGYKQWGLKMQDDLTDATTWAIRAGIADADRVCIYGASYGGYAALMGGIREPDLYKCVVGYVGVYDLEMMFREGDIPEQDAGINYLQDVLGGDVQSLQDRSPVHQVKKLKAPLMIVHGEKDIRAHFKHALALKDALDKVGYEYEWLTKRKEGHGFVNNKNREDLYIKLLAFFDKHIGK
ncbi:alpha/beta hydrolase family protein [Microbulbifer agarilyticus]